MLLQKVGQRVRAKGFITKAQFLRMQTSGELERRLGFNTGRLSDGWWLLFLAEKPGPDDFEFRGYTHMSGGVEQGHLPRPPDPRNAEQRLKDDGYDVARMKQQILRDVFKLQGAERLAKVVPVRGPGHYPQGPGIPQWELVREKWFVVADRIAPGAKYTGNYT